MQDIIEKLHNLLLKLNVLCGGCHPCLLQFLHKKFHGSHRVSIALRILNDYSLINKKLHHFIMQSK